MSDTTAPEPERKSWGYLSTLGWAALAFLAGQILGFGLLLWLRPGTWNSIVTTPYDGVLVTLFIVISNPVVIAVLAGAARLAPASPIDYLALHWPSGRHLWVGIACLVVLIAAFDAALYLGGAALVTPFQLESYSTAAAEGWLPAMWVAAVLVAPAGEEIMFRGFLFRGWARSERSVWPAIVAISVVWAMLHIQYDWVGILQIFVIGIFLGWMRWRSGSTILTFILHALFNLEGTLETLAQLHFVAK